MKYNYLNNMETPKIPITAVHLNKMNPGHTGNAHIYCSATDMHDSIKKKKEKYIQFITCRGCDAPLRMQIQAKKNTYTSDRVDQWWKTIEPMIWVNGCWWYCRDCYPDYPDEKSLLPSENSSGFLKSAINLKLIDKSKPYGEVNI